MEFHRHARRPLRSHHWIEHNRRILPTGRRLAHQIEAEQWTGYSIGRWIDEDNDALRHAGSGDSRPSRAPALRRSALPLHHDNESIFKERIYLDQER